ncbi:MAG: Coenzyme F420:L-glutamate ligase [Nitrosopumilales archaeon]|nr:MAG: Coenzyme F420:L-glutamate ligase [Nitrosopumilales archaeon]
MTLEVIPLSIKREIGTDDKLVDVILSSKLKFEDGDILVLSQKIVSKQEGRIVNISLVIPSILALGIGSEYEKDPKLIEIILSETKRIVRMGHGILIVETKNGLICANAGVDESNVSNGYATLLPSNPDKSARNLRDEIFKKTKKNVAVLISDTFGRPFRMGQTDCAIGVSGIDSIIDFQGKKDTFGKILRITAIAIADELCSASELVKGKTLQNPAAIIRNYKFTANEGTMKSLLRPDDEDLFR